MKRWQVGDVAVVVLACVLAGALPACSLVGGSPSARHVTLVDRGAARVTIYSPLDPQAPADEARQAPQRARLRASVQDLALYLGQIGGAKVEVITGEPPEDAKTIPILIGDLGARRYGPPAVTSPFKQAFRVVVSRKGIACIGESDEATSYAIYEILDRLGCRWYVPGDMGEVIPSMETVRLAEMNVSQVPGTVRRDIWYTDQAYRHRNRLGGIEYRAQHGLEGYITDQQRREHPDWNAEFGGKREPGSRICWGNPEVARGLADNLIQMLDANYQSSVTLSPGDGMHFCECEKCRALDTGDWDPSMACVSITDRYVHFCNQIAERVTAKHPNVLFGILAYVQYTRPPLREKVHPNIVVVLAPITYCRAHSMADPNCPSAQSLRPIVEGWGKATQMLAMYQYAYNLAEVSCPFPMMTKWSEDLPIMFASNVRLWSPETMPNFESTLPGLYLGVRMSWYTKAEPKEILDEFFTRFYGAAAGPMRKYWETIDRAWAEVPEHAGSHHGHVARFTPQVMNAAREALDEALAAARTAMEYRRVKFADDPFREFELYMKMKWDLNAGRWQSLEADMNRWTVTWQALAEQYQRQYAFSPFAAQYLDWMSRATYSDANRIARDFDIFTAQIPAWRYQVDREGEGEKLGWGKPDFDDGGWKTTDPRVEAWSDLGLFDYFGSVWYRASVNVPAVPAGKKAYLWVGSTDGDCKVFVNGQHIPFVNSKGEVAEQFSGYCSPASFDITGAVKPGAPNQITIRGTRWSSYINEIGTGGLMGPVVIYRDK